MFAVTQDTFSAGNEIAFAAISVGVLQWLKKSPRFVFLTERTLTWAKRIWAGVFAILSAHGASYVITHTAPGAGSIAFTGFTWQVMLISLWVYVKQFALQETVYQATAARASKPLP